MLALPPQYTVSGNFCIACNSWSTTTSHHVFPKEETVRKKWLDILCLTEQDIKKNTRVCSKHFKKECFSLAARVRPRLLPGSLPNPLPKCNVTQRKLYNLNKEEHLSQPDDNLSSSSSTLTTTEYLCPTSNILSGTHNPVNGEPSFKTVATQFLSYEMVPLNESKRIRYVGDIKEADFSTTMKTKRNFNIIKKKVQNQQKKIKALQQSNRRLRKKISSLEQMIQHLNDKKLISNEAVQVLQSRASDSLSEIWKRNLKNSKKRYPPELRNFAIALQFYSMKAYNYVRKCFNKILPHPTTISRWYNVVDGDPGFTKEAFTSIKLKAEKEAVMLSLTLDEMSIRDHIQWKDGKFYGYVDMGAGSNYEQVGPHAKNCLVFMAVAINSNWKMPLGYFLINSLNGRERANLLSICLELLSQTGAVCNSITFDGAYVNLAMCKALGAELDWKENMKPWIIHPTTKEKVFIILDACHMIKLVRNCLANVEYLQTTEGHANWNFIKELQSYQSQQGLLAGNKLTVLHINYRQKIMNVRLAAQVLSKSVAAALRFCSLDLKLRNFEDSEATAVFCEMFNDAFDILNSRCSFAKYRYNLPISERTFEFMHQRTESIINYITNLKLQSGRPILTSQKKTGFLGMIINLQNIMRLYEILRKNNLKYLSTYKLSQDHLEIFFSAVRSRFGMNNNPSALQFKYTYKRLLTHAQIGGSIYGNVAELSYMPILYPSSEVKSPKGMDSIFDIEDHEDVGDHDYIFSFYALSPFLEDVVKYIAGYVSKKVISKVNCNECKSVVISNRCTSSLQKLKAWGTLVNASNDVILICRVAEKRIREHQNFFHRDNSVFKRVQNKVFQDCNEKVFKEEKYLAHNNCKLLDGHRYQLITSIISVYLQLRLHHYAREMSMKDEVVRSRYARYIIFRHE